MVRQALLIKVLKLTYKIMQDFKEYRAWKIQMAFMTMKLYLRFKRKLRKHGGIIRKYNNIPRNTFMFVGSSLIQQGRFE